MLVHVAAEGKVPREVGPTFVKSVAKKMLAALQIKEAELSIVLTDDAQIKILNRDYRQKDRPTDVLAFAMREGETGQLAGDLLGDVVISLETAARQASGQGHSLREEVVFLLGHGLLHLLGWDHETKAKDRAMRAETERLCAAAGVAAPKAAGTPQDRVSTKTRAPTGSSAPKLAKTVRQRSATKAKASEKRVSESTRTAKKPSKRVRRKSE